MDDVLKAFAEPRRIAILRLLKGGGLSAGEIAGRFEVTRPAISQHLRVLTRAGLVNERREGTRRIYGLDASGLAGLRALFEEFWDLGLPRLKQAAEDAEQVKREYGKKSRRRR